MNLKMFSTMSGLSFLIILSAASYVRCGALIVQSGDALADGCMMKRLLLVGEKSIVARGMARTIGSLAI